MEPPHTLVEFQQRIALYEVGGSLRSLIVFGVWLAGFILVCFYQDSLFGNAKRFDRFIVGIMVVVFVLLWPLPTIRLYFQRRSRRFGLICSSCNNALLRLPQSRVHIRDAGTCPHCEHKLFDGSNVAT